MQESGCAILYVDDEQGNLSNFSMTFGEEFEGFTASSGPAALAVLEEHPEVGVVVVDQRMPGMTGVELLERICERRPDTVRIVLTAYTDTDEILASINKGHVYQYFFKPWEAAELALSLRRAVERYRLEADNRRLAAELAARNEELARENAELARADARVRELSRELLRAQEEERRRISLYLHDKVAQDLLSLKITCETMLAGAAGREREAVTRLLSRAIHSVRDLACDLRPFDLDRLGLVGAARQETAEFSRRYGLKVDFESVGMEEMELDHETEVNLYRIMQEGLRNAARHSGAAEVTVRLVGSFPDVILKIEDRGAGFEPGEVLSGPVRDRGMGLAGMAERARLCGGELTVRSAPGQGTVLRAVVPVAREEQA